MAILLLVEPAVGARCAVRLMILSKSGSSSATLEANLSVVSCVYCFCVLLGYTTAVGCREFCCMFDAIDCVSTDSCFMCALSKELLFVEGSRVFPRCCIRCKCRLVRAPTLFMDGEWANDDLLFSFAGIPFASEWSGVERGLVGNDSPLEERMDAGLVDCTELEF